MSNAELAETDFCFRVITLRPILLQAAVVKAVCELVDFKALV